MYFFYFYTTTYIKDAQWAKIGKKVQSIMGVKVGLY